MMRVIGVKGGEFTWADGQPDKLVDYQYRAVRELTVTGKSITTAHYGQPIEKSYWLGRSTGGRQGLKEAQRYPQDYDAIIAGAPANNWSPLMSLSIHIERNLGPQGLDPAKLGLLNEAAIAACDRTDGTLDRVIALPDACNFDPGALLCTGANNDACLLAAEVDAARRIYPGAAKAMDPDLSGFVNHGGKLLCMTGWETLTMPVVLLVNNPLGTRRTLRGF
jgi:tannase/feruloyl esterase